jgi:hypothetical protein
MLPFLSTFFLGSWGSQKTNGWIVKVREVREVRENNLPVLQHVQDANKT